MRLRFFFALLLALAASGAAAQDALGVWAFDLLTPAGDVADEGFLVVAPAGEDGRLLLLGQDLDADLTGTTLAASGASFTYAGTLSVGGSGPAFTLEGTVSGEEVDATLVVGDDRLGISGVRSTPEELAEATAPPETSGEGIKDLFEPYPLPTPNTYRAASGRPGPDYWQQEADYEIEATLDPATQMVSGEVVLRYTNNAPEALDFLWFHLEQNLFRPDSRGARAQGSGGTLDARNGYTLGTVTVDGRVVTPFVDDARMRLDLAAPVEASGGTAEIVIPFEFRVPDGEGTPRMGILETAAGPVFSMAQWYPRVAVFDDVNGWNHMPYLGQGEFYLEYGDFDLALTVPAEMTVVATGALQNPREVHTAAQLERLAQAQASGETVRIVTEDEIGQPGVRSGMTTWRYRAENVRDVAWGASAAFMTDGARARVPATPEAPGADVLILSAYPAEGIGTPEEPGWEEATQFGKASIENNSYWLAYPYPVAVNVASHIGGMEYPMLHFSDVTSRHFGLFGVVDHELGHNWFPMIVGSDERRHAWMDEGFNTFINGPSNVRYYDENDDPTIAGYGQSGQSQFVQLVQPELFARLTQTLGSGDDEILTYADQLDGQEGGWNSYFKPAMGLHILRDHVLGEATFDLAFKAYIQRWAYKHPQPADFFRTMEDVSGEDLDWFWRGWFDTIRTYDAALSDLESVTGPDGAPASASVVVSHVGGLVFPAVVEFAFADGTTERVRVPVEAFGVDDGVEVTADAAGRSVVSAALDPGVRLPDTDRSNNTVNVVD